MFARRETSEKASKDVICSWLNSELKVGQLRVCAPNPGSGGQLLCRGHPSMGGFVKRGETRELIFGILPEDASKAEGGGGRRSGGGIGDGRRW
jgi:hypothetical protein